MKTEDMHIMSRNAVKLWRRPGGLEENFFGITIPPCGGLSYSG